MNLLVSSNNTYVLPTIVLLTSICVNNPGNITVYFMYNDLSDENIDKINNLSNSYSNMTINFIYVKNEIFASAPLSARTNSYISVETYFRLAAGELLPKNIDKVLYLDTDIVVNGDISEFYNHVFSESSIALVCEDYGLKIANKLKKEVYHNLNLNAGHIYFNAGVMLINLALLRKKFGLSEFLDFINLYHGHLIFHDQDVMNKMFEFNLEYADYNVYNCRPFFYPFSLRNRQLINRAKIIHYGEKPWNSSFSDMAGELFWKYALVSGFQDEEIEFKKRNNEYMKKNKVQLEIKKLKRNLKLTYLRNIRGIK